MAIETESPFRRVHAINENHEAVLQLVQQLRADAVKRERVIEELRNELKEKDNSIGALRSRIERLERECTHDIRWKPKYEQVMRALKPLKPLLDEQDFNDPTIQWEIPPAEAAPQGPARHAPLSAQRSSRSATSVSSKGTARPLPSPAASFGHDTRGHQTPTIASFRHRDDISPRSTGSDMYASDSGGKLRRRSLTPQDDAQGTTQVVRRVVSPGHQTASTAASTSIIPLPEAETDMPVAVFWKEAPRFADYAQGPYNWDDIHDVLRLDDVQAEEIESLESNLSLGLSVKILNLGSGIGIVAFLYRPMFYETNGKTYLVCWSDRRTRAKHAKYLAPWCQSEPAPQRGSTRPGRPILHVMALPDVDPDAAKGWWYYCAMMWKVVELPSVWDILEPEQRFNLAEHLSEQCPQFTTEHIAGQLQNGELVQLTIQLKPTREDKTLAFQKTVLKLTPGPSPERTPSGSSTS